MHTGGQDDVAWREVEATNRAERRARLASEGLASRGANEELFPGFRGSWAERGSHNQAGNVSALAYDSTSNGLYAVSGGGSLWWGDIEGEDWRVVEQTRRLNPDALLLLDGPNGLRILACEDTRPTYSDDLGRTWTHARSVATATSGWSGVSDFTRVVTPTDTSIYLIRKADYWSDNELLRSGDNGATWTVLAGGLGDRIQHARLVKAPGLDFAVLAAPTEGKLYRVRGAVLTEISTSLFDDHAFTRSAFAGGPSGDSLLLYLVDDEQRVHRSVDTGATWRSVGVVPDEPWRVGLHVDPANAMNVAVGAVELNTSRDGGQTWQLVNRWWDYYDDPANTLHADIMSFESFTTADGAPLTAIGNHGGVSTTGDWFATTPNIGLAGLNVGQYYDVVSHPNYPGWFFAGSQDQGLQRGAGALDEVIDMEQPISGDYGHLSFGDGGRSLYAVYPGTQIMYWADALGDYSGLYEVDSGDETVWLAPMVTDPRPGATGVIVAGGSTRGGAGSYLIELEYDGFDFWASDMPTDFLDESVGGTVSAIATSPVDSTLWFVATSNGRFFRSVDAGETWEQTVNFVPDGHYLYGQAIAPSPVHDSIVYLGGNGYNGPAVYRSDDGGFNFARVGQRMPNTLVYDLAVAPSGDLVFAATESGPYVYVEANDRWYDLATGATPEQTYWSVEWVGVDSIVRFGTYGRGVWDLQVSRAVDISVAAREAPRVDVSASPNPTSGMLTLRASSPIVGAVAVDALGRQTPLDLSVGSARETRVSLARLARGRYTLQVRAEGGVGSVAVVRE